MLMVFGVLVTEVLSRRGLHAFSLAPDIYLVEKKSNYKELEPTFHIGYWVFVRWAFICLLFSSSKLNLLPKKSLSDDIRVLGKRERKKRVKISEWMKNVCFFSHPHGFWRTLHAHYGLKQIGDIQFNFYNKKAWKENIFHPFLCSCIGIVREE